MMPLRRFEMHQPGTIAEAAEMLAHYGDKGRLYAGGTELLLAMKHDLLRYEHLIDLKTVPGLDRIQTKNSSLLIGALVTHRALEKSALVRQHFPMLAEMENQVANVRVRATGTVGGNLTFAEPHSDPATLLSALGASVHIQGRTGNRTLPVDALLKGAYETALAQDEIVVAVEVPMAKKSQRVAYLKFQIHERPTLGLALILHLDGNGQTITQATAVVGSISPTPCRSDRADALLVGQKEQVQARLADAAQALADAADPVDDLEGSAEYKRHLVGVYLRRAFAKALA